MHGAHPPSYDLSFKPPSEVLANFELLSVL